MGVGVQDALAQMLAGQGQRGVGVKTARVERVGDGVASCVMAGDATALTAVKLAGHAAAVGDVLACVGGAGSWWCAGNASATPPADVPVEVDLSNAAGSGWNWVKMQSGLAVCWGSFARPGKAFANAYGNAWFYSDEIAFPFTFTARPHLQGSLVTGSGGLLGMSFHAATNATRAGFYVYSLKHEASIDVYVQVLALGRWK